MKLSIILFFIFILILFFPIKLKAKIIYNLFKNEGFLSIYYYKLQLSIFTLKVVPFKIVLDNGKRQTNIYFFNNEDDSFGDLFLTRLLNQIKIKDFRTYARFGFNSNCMLACMGCTSLTLFSTFSNLILMNKFGNFKSDIQIFPDYINSRFLLCYTISICLNLFIIIKTLFICLLIKLKRSKKNGNKKTG